MGSATLSGDTDACADVRRRLTAYHCTQVQQTLAQLLCESPHPKRQRYTSTFGPTNKTPKDSQTERTAGNMSFLFAICMHFGGPALACTSVIPRTSSPSQAPTLDHPDAIVQYIPLQDATSQDGGNSHSTIVWTQQRLRQNSDVAGGIWRGLTQTNLDEFHRRSEADVGMNCDMTEVGRSLRWATSCETISAHHHILIANSLGRCFSQR